MIWNINYVSLKRYYRRLLPTPLHRSPKPSLVSLAYTSFTVTHEISVQFRNTHVLVIIVLQMTRRYIVETIRRLIILSFGY